MRFAVRAVLTIVSGQGAPGHRSSSGRTTALVFAAALTAAQPGCGTGHGDGAAAGSSGAADGGGDGSSTVGVGDGGGRDAAPVHACDGLAPPGTWENITPPVMALPGNAPCPYGGAFVMNPLDPGILYVGTCNEGLWKTTDCGASWAHINTGANGTVLDAGRQWTFVMDPVDPDVLYTNSGYGGVSNGAFKSTDGGVNWSQIWPPSDPALSGIVTDNFVGQVVMDPADRQHLLLSFHATCSAPYASACFGESKDGGTTWRLISGDASWNGGEGQVIYFLESGTTWLWGSQSNGLWRTTDGGASWTAVTDSNSQGHATGQLFRAKTGVFYLPGPNGILRSPDGVVWTLVPGSGDTMDGLTGNGTSMFASRGFPWDPSTVLYEPFWTSPEGDGQHWAPLPSPMLSNGGELAYDTLHHLLYSSNLGAGVWRVVTGP